MFAGRSANRSMPEVPHRRRPVFRAQIWFAGEVTDVSQKNVGVDDTVTESYRWLHRRAFSCIFWTPFCRLPPGQYSTHRYRLGSPIPTSFCNPGILELKQNQFMGFLDPKNPGNTLKYYKKETHC